uniref:SUN domain-containing protein n=1 Tax=Syphacia muris TaxID=451379 RepID=A0A0N5AZE0_9BILA
MVAKNSRTSNGPVVTFTQIEKRSVDIVNDRSAVSDFGKLRCIRGNVKTERAFVSPEESLLLFFAIVSKKFLMILCHFSFQDLSLVQPVIDSFFPTCSKKLPEIGPPNYKSLEAIQRGPYTWLRPNCFWWSFPLIIFAVLAFLLCRNYYLVHEHYDTDRFLQLREFKSDVVERFAVMLSKLETKMENLITNRNSNLAEEFRKVKINDNLAVIGNINEGFVDLREKYKTLKKECSMNHVESLVKNLFEIYDADKTGFHDFAAESAGGMVVLDRTSATYTISSDFFGFSFSSSKKSPATVIQVSIFFLKLGFGPGECWPFAGSAGVIVIKLSQRANVTAVSYEHLSSRLSPDGSMRSAPKRFQIWVVLHIGYDDVDEKHSRRMLGEYAYLNTGPTLQFFTTQIFISPVAIRFVEFRVLSNYGSPYTCLYKFRVHGLKADTVDFFL